MLNLILRYGFLAGVIVGAPMLYRMLTATETEAHFSGMLVGYLTMLVALTAVFIGVKQYRDKFKGGVVRFQPALGVGLGISVVASLLYVLSWEISIAFSKFDFVAWWQHEMIAGAQARGATATEIARVTREAQDFATMYANPVWRMAMTFAEIFPVGLLVSLVTAAVLRNPRVLPARRGGLAAGDDCASRRGR
jgi:hypothetical protein